MLPLSSGTGSGGPLGDVRVGRRTVAALASTLLTAGLAAGPSAPSSGSERTSSVDEGSGTRAGAARDPQFKPGRVGPIRVGMSSRQAVATGLVRRNRNPGCGEQRLMGKGYLERHLLIRSRPGHGITEMLTWRRRLHGPGEAA